MIRPMRAAACAVAVCYLPTLAACAGVPAAAVVLGTQAALAVASGAYCTATTEPGKQTLRDRLTGGVAVMRCGEGR